MVRIGIAIVGIGQAIVGVRHGRARHGLVDAGMEKLAMRAGSPSAFCRRERSPTQQAPERAAGVSGGEAMTWVYCTQGWYNCGWPQ
jgi:hypothetical protein